MKKIVTASLLCGTLLLTGCTESADNKEYTRTEQQAKNYTLAKDFMMYQVKYKSFTIYIEESQKQIEKTIASYVKKEGFNEEGYDKEGYDRRGYNRNGFDREGYDPDGFNRLGINKEGTTHEGKPSHFKSPYDRYGYDVAGYDEDGYDRYGYNRQGFNEDGFNKEGDYKDASEESIQAYNKREWNEIPKEEQFQHALYFPLVQNWMKKQPKLQEQYYEQGVHPFSESAYHLNLLYNTQPALFDDLLPFIRIEAVAQFQPNHLNKHDQKIRLEAEDGTMITLIQDDALLPKYLERKWSTLESVKEGQTITLDTEEGVSVTYEVVQVTDLAPTEQIYIDVARQAIQQSKGKWAEAQYLFDEAFYKAVDAEEKEIALNQAVLNELKKEREKSWPKNYLHDSNEEIEVFNEEAREQLITQLMHDVSGYDLMKKELK